MKKYIVEFIGTFFLVLTIGSVVIGAGAGNLAPLAIGSALMVFIYAGGHISGAHYNPAVTVAVWVRGKCPTIDVPGYIIAQLLGSVAAALVVGVLYGDKPVAPLNPIVPHLVLAEFLYTFALAYVVLNVATAEKTSGNSNYGLAIGFTVLTGAYAVGGISGGVFNPAVAVGVAMLGILPTPIIGAYFAAQFGAGLCAGLLGRAFLAVDQPELSGTVPLRRAANG